MDRRWIRSRGSVQWLQNNTEPEPLLLGRLEETSIIEEWQNLAKEGEFGLGTLGIVFATRV